MLIWQDEKTDDSGIRSRALLYYGAVAVMLVQLPENAPVTYVEHHGCRVGPFSSWEDAMRFLETREKERVGLVGYRLDTRCFASSRSSTGMIAWNRKACRQRCSKSKLLNDKEGQHG